MTDLTNILEALKVDDVQSKVTETASTYEGVVDETSNGVARLTEASDEESLDIEAAIVESAIPQIRSLSWTIPTSQTGRLLVNGNPLIVRGLSFWLTNIAWRAGGGWPVYRHPSPRRVIAGRQFAAPGLWEHSVVFGVGRRAFQAYDFHGSINTNTTAQVFVGINDSLYSDNVGTYTIHLNGWW